MILLVADYFAFTRFFFKESCTWDGKALSLREKTIINLQQQSVTFGSNAILFSEKRFSFAALLCLLDSLIVSGIFERKGAHKVDP